MKDKLREYRSKDISVTWSKTRCIHFAACVHHLPDVFDTDQKPWVQPDRADAEEVAQVVVRCPTGALHFERKDGGAAEEVPERNTVQVAPHGPLYLRGDIRITLDQPDQEILLRDTRVALCRCGASAYGPLCDGSHREIGFRDRGELGNVHLDGERRAGRLEVSPTPNGPLRLRGPFELIGSDDEREKGTRTALCRCGASGNKPFCDGTHRAINFTSADAVIDGAHE